MDTEGGVVSEGDGLGVVVGEEVGVGLEITFDTLTVIGDELVWLLEESRAEAKIVCAPLVFLVLSQEYEQVEPEQAVTKVLSTNIEIEETDTLSEAEAWILTVPESVCPSIGEVKETVGGVVSAGEGVGVGIGEGVGVGVEVDTGKVVPVARARALAALILPHPKISSFPGLPKSSAELVIISST